MTAVEIQRHIDYLQWLFAELADPAEKADVLDDLVFYRMKKARAEARASGKHLRPVYHRCSTSERGRDSGTNRHPSPMGL